MEKIIVVTFTGGTKQELDGAKVEGAIGGAMIGLPANHDIWLKALQQIACFGVLADGSDDKYVRYIPPSQIESVELIFSEPLKKA